MLRSLSISDLSSVSSTAVPILLLPIAYEKRAGEGIGHRAQIPGNRAIGQLSVVLFTSWWAKYKILRSTIGQDRKCVWKRRVVRPHNIHCTRTNNKPGYPTIVLLHLQLVLMANGCLLSNALVKGHDLLLIITLQRPFSSTG